MEFDGFKATLEPRGCKVTLGTQPKDSGTVVDLPKDSEVVVLNRAHQDYVTFSACYLEQNEMRHFSATEEDFKKYRRQEGTFGTKTRAKKVTGRE